jgi:hypothetical protein
LLDLTEASTAGELKRDEFIKISKEMVGLDSFSFGKAATELRLPLGRVLVNHNPYPILSIPIRF